VRLPANVLSMRRHIPDADSRRPLASDGEWLDLDALCTVEISSEDPAHPIEGALVGGRGRGWRAAAPGPQTLRLRFDVPQSIRRIVLEFVEPDVERTQEIAVSAVASGDAPTVRELRRQRWNFSPGGSSEETEDWRVDLDGITRLDLVIDPDVSGGPAHASLASLRLA
jgi:hypothetical protein